MPLFDVQCYGCSYKEERLLDPDEVPICELCGEPLRFIFGGDTNYHPFREGWYEHIALEPVYIKNKKQLVHECRKRGLTSHYVEGGKFSEV